MLYNVSMNKLSKSTFEYRQKDFSSFVGYDTVSKEVRQAYINREITEEEFMRISEENTKKGIRYPL